MARQYRNNFISPSLQRKFCSKEKLFIIRQVSRAFMRCEEIMQADDGFLSGFLGGFLYGLNFSDLAIPFALCLWALIFLVKLTDIDVSSPIIIAMYTIYCISSGIILVFIIPESFTGKIGFRTQLVMCLLFGIAAASRCLLHLRRFNKKKV